METLKGFQTSAPTRHPPPPLASLGLAAMVRAEQSSAAPHAFALPARNSTWCGPLIMRASPRSEFADFTPPAAEPLGRILVTCPIRIRGGKVLRRSRPGPRMTIDANGLAALGLVLCLVLGPISSTTWRQWAWR
jgi:hypothetical protein